MRGNEFLDKMELIDPAYIEAADAAPKAKRTAWTLWRAAMAACLCLVLLAGTAAAAAVISGSGTWLADIFTATVHGSDGDQVSSVYTIRAEIEKFPVSSLSGEMQAVGEEIKRQFEADPADSEQDPGVWQKRFSTPGEAGEFIGLDALKVLDWNVGEHYNTSLNIWGDASGKIKNIDIYTMYLVDDIVLNMDTNIRTEYTDNQKDEASFLAMEDVEITDTVYTAASGKQCQIMSYFSPKGGRRWINGYMADGGILYTLFANCAEQDAARAEELLHQWADMF